MGRGNGRGKGSEKLLGGDVRGSMDMGGVVLDTWFVGAEGREMRSKGIAGSMI